MAVTGSNPVLGALVAGQNIRDSLTLATDFVSSGGNLQPVLAQIKRGTGPWKDLQQTETAVLDQAVKVRQIAFDGGFAGGAFESETVTPTAATSATQTAVFGAQTIAGQGGFKPVDAEGNDLDVISIVSGGATTPPAQVVDGRLCFNGVGAPDGATIRVAHATGEVDILIDTVSGRSVHTPAHINSALFTQRTASSPLTIYLRPGAYDVNAGGAQTAGIFQSKNMTAAAATIIRGHPGQSSRPYFYKPNTSYSSNWYSTRHLTIEGCDFRFVNRSQMITSGTNGSQAIRTQHITLRDVGFIGPDIPLDVLQDPTRWPTGYAGVLAVGPNFAKAHNITLDNVRFINIENAGDYCPENLVLRNVVTINAYGDNLRIASNAPLALGYDTPCILDGIRAHGFFGINNEMQAGGFGLAPHNDFIQVIGGGTIRFLVVKNCVLARGENRGITVQSLQQNAYIDRATYHENVLFNRDAPWGRNDEGAYYNLINQCTMAADSLNATTAVRFGGTIQSSNGTVTPRPAYGEQRIRNSYIANSGGSSTISIGLNNEIDPAIIVNENSHYPSGTAANTLLQGPPAPINPDAAMLAARPIPGSVIDMNGIGAIGLDGEFRGTEIPPLPGQAPTLSAAAGNVTITPSASLHYDTLPTVWEWRHRDGSGATWSGWTEATGAGATGAGLAQSGRQFMYRWKNAAGVAGVPSVVSVLP